MRTDLAVEVSIKATGSAQRAVYGIKLQPGSGDDYRFAVLPGDQEYRVYPAGGSILLRGRSSAIACCDRENQLRVELFDFIGLALRRKSAAAKPELPASGDAGLAVPT